MSKRDDFVALVRSLEGKPYIWSAKGPNEFDCSGLVTFALHKIGGPDWRAFYNCQKLEKELPAIDQPALGDLVLYGRAGRASHVMVYLGGKVFGATGGDSSTTSLKEAKVRGARVKYRESINYRKDLIGYRSLAVHFDEG